MLVCWFAAIAIVSQCEGNSRAGIGVRDFLEIAKCQLKLR